MNTRTILFIHGLWEGAWYSNNSVHISVSGHSMGGLLAQQLAAKGLAVAGVWLCPASPSGILALTPSVIKSFRSALIRWKFRVKPYKPTFQEAVYSMLHLLPVEQQEETYAGFFSNRGVLLWRSVPGSLISTKRRQWTKRR